MDGSAHRAIRNNYMPLESVTVFDSFLYLVYRSDRSIVTLHPNNRSGRRYDLETKGKGVVLGSLLARYKDELCFVGAPKDATYESIFKINFRQPRKDYQVYVDRNFTRITGLSVYAADTQVRTRRNNCAHHNPCAGICLLSGTDSFRCLCPSEAELQPDGFSCQSKLPPSCDLVDFWSQQVLNFWIFK